VNALSTQPTFAVSLAKVNFRLIFSLFKVPPARLSWSTPCLKSPSKTKLVYSLFNVSQSDDITRVRRKFIEFIREVFRNAVISAKN
jgi:hypothetical protein